MTFRLAPTAQADLERLAQYHLFVAGPITSGRIVARILDACERLAAMPGMGHPRPDWTDRPILFFHLRPHWIAYLPDTDPLQIINIFHSAQDVARKLR
jgi:plasmid stabilization system protein ParE